MAWWGPHGQLAAAARRLTALQAAGITLPAGMTAELQAMQAVQPYVGIDDVKPLRCQLVLRAGISDVQLQLGDQQVAWLDSPQPQVAGPALAETARLSVQLAAGGHISVAETGPGAVLRLLRLFGQNGSRLQAHIAINTTTEPFDIRLLASVHSSHAATALTVPLDRSGSAVSHDGTLQLQVNDLAAGLNSTVTVELQLLDGDQSLTFWQQSAALQP